MKMGANLVTAYWDPSDMDRAIKRSLANIAVRHGASVKNDDGFDQCAQYKTGKTSFSADISSFSIIWHGGQDAAINTLKKIQGEWDRDLSLLDVQGVSINVISLPM